MRSMRLHAGAGPAGLIPLDSALSFARMTGGNFINAAGTREAIATD